MGSKIAKTLLTIVTTIGVMLGCAAVALAEEPVSVWGSQTQLSQSDVISTDTQVKLNVLGFSGPKGETVFLTVNRGAANVATFLPHKLGETLSSGEEGQGLADTFAIAADRASLEADLEAGAYTVDAYQSRADKNPAHFTVYGVWALLQGESDDAQQKLLMGSITSGGSQQASFVPMEYLTYNGATYELQGSTTGTAQGNLYYSYKKLSAESAALNGVVKFVNEQGEVISASKVANLAQDGTPTKQAIPKAVTGSDGKVYRTLTNLKEVSLSSPNATTFTVLCAALSDANAVEAGHYLATIQMVDDANPANVIAVDTLNVRGSYIYTAPSTIYKKRPVGTDGQSQVYTYTIADPAQAVQTLVPTPGDSADRTITIRYRTEALEALETQVTYNLLDGTQRENRQSADKRKLGTKTVTVNAESKTATPDEQITANGKTYKLAGSVSNYAYEYGSGELPVINAYYVPTDYVAPGPYEVTINYVNVADESVISSETATSTDTLDDLILTPPEQFSERGTTWVRLPGQTHIRHNYYARPDTQTGVTYVVFYRDQNAPIESGVAVGQTRVVYTDGVQTTVAQPATTTGTAAPAGTAATGTAAQPGAVENAATTMTQLNTGTLYNVIEGAAFNQNLTTEAGVDSNTERIDDEEVALSSGVEEENAANQGSPIVPAVIAVAVLVILVLAVLAWRRRNSAQL